MCGAEKDPGWQRTTRKRAGGPRGAAAMLVEVGPCHGPCTGEVGCLDRAPAASDFFRVIIFLHSKFPSPGFLHPSRGLVFLLSGFLMSELGVYSVS